MKKFLNNIRDEAQHYRMSEAEKSAMRAHILGTPSPVRVQRSPYVFLSYFTYQTRMVMAGFMLFIVAGVSTVSAAQGALPGDILYPVKLSINEKVEMALAPDEAAKATLEVALAERRVEEAQSLAAQGRLDEASAEALAISFDAHAGNAQSLADASEEREPGISEQVKTKLSASLAVHGAVLKTLGKSNRTKEQSDALGDKVIARAEGPILAMNTRAFAAVAPVAESEPAQMKAAGDATAAMEVMSFSAASDTSAPAPQDTGNQKKAARFQKKAAEAISEARKLFDEAKGKLDATTTAQVETSFAEADTRMSEGAEASAREDYAFAQERFMTAFQIAGKLEALLRAEKRFDNGILKQLIRTELNGEVQGVSVEVDVPAVEPQVLEVEAGVRDDASAAPAASQPPAPAVRIRL